MGPKTAAALIAVAFLAVVAGAAFAQPEEQTPAKEETPVGGPVTKGKDDKPQKKLTVYELVGKLLKIKVAVKGPKVKPDVAADIAGKVEGALKDCVVKEIKANEKYLVNDDKLYRSKTALSVKLDAGVFKKVKAAVSGKSPIMKACMGSLDGLETGFGDMNQQITASVETGLK